MHLNLLLISGPESLKQISGEVCFLRLKFAQQEGNFWKSKWLSTLSQSYVLFLFGFLHYSVMCGGPSSQRLDLNSGEMQRKGATDCELSYSASDWLCWEGFNPTIIRSFGGPGFHLCYYFIISAGREYLREYKCIYAQFKTSDFAGAF